MSVTAFVSHDHDRPFVRILLTDMCHSQKGTWPTCLHSATAGYPARSSKLLDFDGKSARMGMASCLITVISPSDTVGHKASYGIPNATMRRFRNRSQNGAERRQPRWRLIEYSPILLVRVVRKIGKCSWVYKKVIHVFHIHLPIFL